MVAVSQNYHEITKLLLDRGANIEAKDAEVIYHILDNCNLYTHTNMQIYTSYTLYVIDTMFVYYNSC